MLGNRDPSEPASPFSSEAQDREAAFGVLKDPIRRAVLRHLDSDERWVALEEVAECIAGDSRIGDRRDPDRLAAALHHNHLPKLAECGLVEYDHRENRVAADRESVEPPLGRFED